MKKNKKTIIIIGIVFFLTLAIGGIAYTVARNKKKKEGLGSEEDVKKDLKPAKTLKATDGVGIKTGDAENGFGPIFTDYGDGWHYQRKKKGGWYARKASGGQWYDLTTNTSYQISIDKLNAKYGA